MLFLDKSSPQSTCQWGRDFPVPHNNEMEGMRRSLAETFRLHVHCMFLGDTKWAGLYQADNKLLWGIDRTRHLFPFSELRHGWCWNRVERRNWQLRCKNSLESTVPWGSVGHNHRSTNRHRTVCILQPRVGPKFHHNSQDDKLQAQMCASDSSSRGDTIVGSKTQLGSRSLQDKQSTYSRSHHQTRRCMCQQGRAAVGVW